ncbi:MAG: gliding motility-associated C-terminal domain-containing protein [Flavobacteriales bacterium]|nr:gliding motility-associated C-terminal domain-containing protein [Flavobacteriales bacterium]
MNRPFLNKEAILALLALISFSSLCGQDCSSAQTLCPNEATPTYTFAEGSALISAPDSSCLGDSQVLFYSFSTLDINQFPFVDYTDSTATVQYSVDSCSSDTAIGIAVLTASDLCDGTTFSATETCEVDTLGGGQFELSDLQPSTTYQVIISNLNTTDPQSECFVNVNVSGPAVEYDLGAIGYQQGVDPNSGDAATEIFEGETAVLTAEDDFGDITWQGPQLNQTMGSEVTANPEGVGISVDYVASVEIDGCTFTDNVSVFILPPIVTSNAFTPNGDGVNDVWWIEGIDLWPNAQIFVYSRWGNKVFQAINYENDWGGDDLPAATYYYVIELNPVDFEADPITGSVTIMR